MEKRRNKGKHTKIVRVTLEREKNIESNNSEFKSNNKNVKINKILLYRESSLWGITNLFLLLVRL